MEDVPELPQEAPQQQQATQGVGKKEKGRVRFNSSAGAEPPAVSPTSNAFDLATPLKAPRPSLLRGGSYNSVLDFANEDDGASSPDKRLSAAAAAFERAQRAQAAAYTLGSHSAPGSRRGSFDSEVDTPASTAGLLPIQTNIPLEDFSGDHTRTLHSEAYDLVRSHTQHPEQGSPADTLTPLTRVSGLTTPENEFAHLSGDEDEALARSRGGVLSHLLKLYQLPNGAAGPRSGKGADFSGYTTPGSSGTLTPTRRKWYDQEKNQSQDTLANLAKASAILANPGEKHKYTPKRPKHKRASSSRFMSMIGRPRMEDEARITIHVADILKRQQYIIKLCRALMLFGAPTHRLEEVLQFTSRYLEIDAQFLYIPGCMIISFDDRSTHTTEMKIVRTAQGINLGKLKDVHEINKNVLHDNMTLEEGTTTVQELIAGKDQFHPWFRVIVYGFASATVAPFAFGGRFIDMPIAFLLGSLVGVLQLIVAPMSELYSNIFEITAAILTSFLARAFGSINNGQLFCFSALAQSSIALILPGYLVLCAALELQSRNIVPGSIRMVYAIIYSLFLGFGITVGTALYGLMDTHATSSTTCSDQPLPYYRFIFVLLFAACLAYINQAKWKQMPMMVLIAMAGYTVNFFSSMRLPASAQISNTLGALTIGALANLYSRLSHGVAAAAMLPAIFVQVPSGLAASGSLLAGLNTADQLTNSTKGAAALNQDQLNGMVFNVGASMIQIAIGITVGLFLSALLVYPFGKRRSGLFTL